MKKSKNKKIQIVLAGFGGQGILFMGKMLAQAALMENKHLTLMPSYGAEVRGGTAHSMVIISDLEIASPYVSEPDICVVMNNPSLKRFEPRVKKRGVLIINSSLCEEKVKRNDIKTIKIPATSMAEKIGDGRVANMILLGVLAGASGIFSLKSAIDSLEALIPAHRKGLIPLNKKALMKGASSVSGKSKG